ncbi:MAG: hypothetical protein ACRDHZ_10600 [Ktedonobacteraceae bacterium]
MTIRGDPRLTGFPDESTTSTITLEFIFSSGGIWSGLKDTRRAVGIPPTFAVVTVRVAGGYPGAIALIIVFPGRVVVEKLTGIYTVPAGKVTLSGTVPVCGLEDVSNTVIADCGM